MELVMASVEKPKTTIGQVFGGIVVILVIGFAISKCDTNHDKCTDDAMAQVMSQEIVKKLLKAPASADFPLAESKVTIDKAANETNKNRCYFKVSANVDSQNSFGAMIRNRYNVEMIYDKTDDNWYSRNLNIK